MVKVTFYGQPTSEYEYVKRCVLDHTQSSPWEIQLEEIVDIQKIINAKIGSIPTVRINGRPGLEYHRDDDINQFVENIIHSIEKEANHHMKTIIVPTDFSETAQNALQYAQELAKPFNASLVLMHAYHPVVMDVQGTVMVDNEMEGIRRTQLNQWVENAQQQSPNTTITSAFRIGYAVPEVKKICSELEHDMVVMGSTGSGGSLKPIFGSVSTELSRNTPSPIWIIPRKARFRPVEKILFGIHDIEGQLSCVKKLITIASLLNAEIHFVHVAQNKQIQGEVDFMDTCKSLYSEDKLFFHTVIHSDPLEGLTEFATNEQMNIIALSPEKRGFIEDLFRRKLSKRLAIYSNLPILIIH